MTNFLDSDDDDDDDMPPGSPAVPPAPPDLTEGFQPFINDPGSPLVRPARENYFPYSFRIEGVNDPKFEDEIVLDRNLKKVFPKANKVFNDGIEIRENEEYAEFRDKLDRGEIPEELQFFSGGSENISSLYNEINSHNLTARNQEFIEYLATDECRDALERDGISVHVPGGDIFINNENTGESLYTFLNNQQDESKKEIPLDFTYDDDYTDYMTNYLPAINEFDEVKHDFLTNKNSKFKFHLFNKYQEDRGRPKFPIRHSTLTDDNYALSALQDRNWPYFINRIIEFSQGFINLSDLQHSDATEINILNNTRANFEIVKTVYNELFTSVGINLHELFKNVGVLDKQKIDNDLTNNNFYPWESQEDFIQQRILTTYRDFYYETGRFPGRTTLIPVLGARIPDFIQSQDVLSPRSLYESYVGRDMQGIVSLQFLAAFNRFLGGEKEVSRDAMSERFHNLSWQALTNDNDSIQVQFEAVTVLVQSINRLIQKQIYEQKKEQIQRGKEVPEKLTRKEKEDSKTEIEKIEEKVVNDIIQSDQTDYTPYFELPTVKTEDEIDEDRKEWNKQFLEGQLAKNERDFEIIEDIETKNKFDLIKDTIDPGDGIFTDEETGHLDYTRTERDEPAAPQLNPSVLKGIGVFLQGMSQAVSEQTSDDLPELKYIPDVKYEELEEIKPNLQEILTQPEPEDFIEDIKNIKEEVKAEIEDIFVKTEPGDENNDPLMQEMPEIFEDGEFDDTEFVQQHIPEFRSDQNRLDLDVRAKATYALVPTEIKVEDDDPAEILANLNVTTILPPISDGRIYVPLPNFD